MSFLFWTPTAVICIGFVVVLVGTRRVPAWWLSALTGAASLVLLLVGVVLLAHSGSDADHPGWGHNGQGGLGSGTGSELGLVFLANGFVSLVLVPVLTFLAVPIGSLLERHPRQGERRKAANGPRDSRQPAVGG
jgi:hypothetical protein